MCVHCHILGHVLFKDIVVDIRILAENKFDILIIPLKADLVPIPDSLLQVLENNYKLPRFTFKEAGLQNVRWMPFNDVKADYGDIHAYTFSPYGICSLMSFLKSEQEAKAAGRPVREFRAMTATLVNGVPDYSQIREVHFNELPPPIQRYQTELAAKEKEKNAKEHEAAEERKLKEQDSKPDATPDPQYLNQNAHSGSAQEPQGSCGIM